VALRPNAGHGLLVHEVSRSHTTTYHSRYDSSGRVISSSQRSLPDNTQHSNQTHIYAPVGIRTHDLSRRAAADLRLKARPLGPALSTYISTKYKFHFLTERLLELFSITNYFVILVIFIGRGEYSNLVYAVLKHQKLKLINKRHFVENKTLRVNS
jgi:hypothetical protein